MIAVVEWDPANRSYGRTSMIEPDCSDDMMLMQMAARAEGNIDKIVLQWGRAAKEQHRDHGSIVLARFGLSELAKDRT